MNKFYIVLFYYAFLSSMSSNVNAWETNLKSSCINENLDPCSSAEILSNKSSEYSDLNFDEVTNDKEKIIDSNIDKKKKKIAIKNKVAKRKKKNIFKRFLFNKSGKNIDFDKNNSFEDFKTSLIEYNNNKDYPNIDN